jgi:lipopolysaccharide transport system permease protein
MLFAGLILYNAFAECLKKAPTLITANPNFVKKVVFPLELLPWVMALGAAAQALLGIVVWLGGYVVLFGWPRLTALYCPLVLAVFFPVLLGLGWLLAAVGVFVRDVGHATELVAHALLFLTPIFYSVDAAPVVLRRALMLNPLTFVIEQFRQVLFVGHGPDLAGLALYLAAAVLFSGACLLVFRRLRPAFADLV